MNDSQNKLQTKLFVSLMVMTFGIGISMYIQTLSLKYADLGDVSMSNSCDKICYMLLGVAVYSLFIFIKTAVIIEKTR
jgi:hypothetical protein